MEDYSRDMKGRGCLVVVVMSVERVRVGGEREVEKDGGLGRWHGMTL